MLYALLAWFDTEPLKPIHIHSSGLDDLHFWPVSLPWQDNWPEEPEKARKVYPGLWNKGYSLHGGRGEWLLTFHLLTGSRNRGWVLRHQSQPPLPSSSQFHHLSKQSHQWGPNVLMCEPLGYFLLLNHNRLTFPKLSGSWHLSGSLAFM